MAHIIAGRSEERDSPIVMDEPACLERNVIMRMINDHSFTIDQAIHEICDLTAAASAEDFQASTSSETGVAHRSLHRHSGRVQWILQNLAVAVPHDRQSRLIEFILRLEKSTVPDPNRGGIVGDGKDIFWTSVPSFSRNLVRLMVELNDNGEFDPAQENLAAFLAQLFEAGYSGCERVLDWTYAYTAAVFQTGFTPDKRNVRMFCIWLIYANRKLWLDTQGPNRLFRQEFWEGWRALLLDCQSSNQDWCSDEDTQMLMMRALDCMHITQAEN
ncbi:unnamed protein product [Clonostachys solani]|uniref:Uncharacterized protein n=1 Tax=Clonostachys solani TaxID=160281 RepID=A0A9N9Z4P2_9HYPO|nr:unnamed protein product [Clonostachys solani]